LICCSLRADASMYLLCSLRYALQYHYLLFLNLFVDHIVWEFKCIHFRSFSHI
ncbi:hypothetical protein L9F63_002557, partial [Diploptera punctata]